MNTEKKTGKHPNSEIKFEDNKIGRFVFNRFAIRDHWLEIEKEWIFGTNTLQTDS